MCCIIIISTHISCYIYFTNYVFQINGENLLTVQYDRDTHTETIMKKDLQEIITIRYDDSGLPTSFSPANGHHDLNITYRQDGHISHWQYGEIREQRIYTDNGLLRERLSSAGAQYVFRYRYGHRVSTLITCFHFSCISCFKNAVIKYSEHQINWTKLQSISNQ